MGFITNRLGGDSQMSKSEVLDLLLSNSRFMKQTVIISKKTFVVNTEASVVRVKSFELKLQMLGLFMAESQEFGAAERKVKKWADQGRIATYTLNESPDSPATQTAELKYAPTIAHKINQGPLTVIHQNVQGEEVIQHVVGAEMTEQEWQAVQDTAFQIAVAYQQNAALNFVENSNKNAVQSSKPVSTSVPREERKAVHSKAKSTESVDRAPIEEEKKDKSERAKLLEKQRLSHAKDKVQERMDQVKENHQRWDKKSEKISDRNQTYLKVQAAR